MMNTSSASGTASDSIWRNVRRYLAAYGLAVGAPVLVIAVGCYLGARVYGGMSSSADHAAPAAASRPLLHLLVALTAILVVSRVFGALFVRLGQPKVVGEIVAGIALGPSLLGAIAPGAAAELLAPAIMPHLESIGQLGLILFMFLVGLEFNFSVVRRRAHVALLVSHTSICLPFLGGAMLGLFLYSSRYEGTVPFLPFTLFMGLAMSVTAFPVLTRILHDRKLHATPLGAMALACAAADDITAWCLLAALLGVANAQLGAGFTTLAATLLYCLGMWGIVRPLAKRLATSAGFSNGNLATWLLGLFCFALMAEWIGIHAFFGAFLFGLCVPRDAPAIAQLKSKLEDLTACVLMPAFFVCSGMRTEVGLLHDVDGWLICGLVIAVASAGKLVGTIVPARVAGLGWRDSMSLGVLMNTRGLMEIVIANVGLEFGIIPPQMFTALVIMALVTTCATGPLLNLLERGANKKRCGLEQATFGQLPVGARD